MKTLVLIIATSWGLGLAAGSLDDPAEVDRLLRNKDPKAVVKKLIPELRGARKRRAVEILGRLGDPSAVPALLPLVKTTDGELKASVAYALGRCRSPQATPVLRQLAADTYAPTRAAAMWALGAFDSPETTRLLLRGLTDNDRTVRLATVRGISAGGHRRHVSLLIPRLDYQVRPEPDKKNPELLVNTLYWSEPDAAVRLAVTQALQKLQVIDAVPAMIYAMERELSFNRLVLKQTIESFGPSAARTCLGRIVPTPYDREAFDKRMRLLINNGTLAVIAGRLGEPRCVPHLLKNLKLPRQKLGPDKDLTELYIDTVVLLGRYRVRQAADPLAVLLKQTRIKQLSEVLQLALRRIGRPAARPLARNADDWRLAPVFLPLLREPDLRTAKLRKHLLKFLAHESSQVRYEAVQTLGLYLHEGILDAYDMPLLEAMYTDPDRSVRQVCAKWKEKITEKPTAGEK